MKRISVFTISLLACALLAAVPVYAEQTKPKSPSEATMSQAELNGYTEEAWSALKDNLLEFDEIKELVHNFNPTMSNYWDSYDDSVRSVEYSAEIMKEAKQSAIDNYDKYKNSPYLDDMTKAQLKGLVTLTTTMVGQYNNTYRKLNKNNSANLQLRQAEDQITKAVQQMMIGYKTIEANVDILKELVNLNQASLNAYKAMQEKGMATETDVLNAQAGLISAKSNLASLEAARKQLYGQLITMCGWDAKDNVVIGEIPATAQTRIDAMNPETDFEKAEGNNTTLISLRKEGKKNSEGSIDAQKEYYGVMQDNLRIKLDTMYADVMSAQYALEAAEAGYEGAKIQKEALKAQYESGMLSEAQYIGASLQVAQKKAALATARYNLGQAVLNYEWALKGYCDLK